MSMADSATRDGQASATVDSSGDIIAFVLLSATKDRVFKALTSSEICRWWARPGFFDTREWTGDVRPGGQWHASGMGKTGPYQLQGEFTKIERPDHLVHSWQAVGAPGAPSTVTYDLSEDGKHVRLSLRHAGIMAPDVRENTRAGWLTSFELLQQTLMREGRA